MNMFNLYLVKRNATWKCSYDELNQAVVRAKSAEEAREFMSDHFGNEEKYKWIDPTFSSCKQVTGEDGKQGLVVADFWEA